MRVGSSSSSPNVRPNFLRRGRPDSSGRCPEALCGQANIRWNADPMAHRDDHVTRPNTFRAENVVGLDNTNPVAEMS